MSEFTHEGRILKTDTQKRYTLGIVYEPNVLDSQGDWSDAEEIEKACWRFMKYLQGKTEVTKIALAVLDAITKSLKDNSSIEIDITDIWDDIEKISSALGYMHNQWDESIGDIVECFIAPVDFEVGSETVKRGTWLLGVVWSEEYFKKIEAGEVTGFSMGGRGKRIYEDELGK